MSVIKEQCVYYCGPYKGYSGRADYGDAAGMFHGEIVGTKDVVTFQGATLDELRAGFKGSVDDYLKFCHDLGQPAEKPFSGKFVARMTPGLHRRLSAMAQTAGKSLNQFVCDLLESVAKSERDEESLSAVVRKATRVTVTNRAKKTRTKQSS